MRSLHRSALPRLPAAALLALLACAGPPPPPGAIEVEVLPGGVRAPAADPGRPRPLVVVLDATRSMAGGEPGRPTPFDVAREAARAVVAAAAGGVPLDVRLLGGSGAGTCGPASRLEGSEGLAALAPGGEASLAVALGGIAREAQAAPLDPAPRIVVLSDLGGECGGDLCEAAARVVEAGAELAVIAVGDRPPPACLRSIDVDPARAPEWAIPPDPRGADFVALDVSSGVILARGSVGGGPVPVPPRAVLLRLDLDPPLRLGPVLVEPGTLTRVRILDFPRADPPVREWQARIAGPAPAVLVPPEEPGP